MDTQFGERGLPPHIEAAVHSIAQLHVEHHKNATPLQRTLGGIKALLAQPWFIGVLTALLVGWIGFNLLIEALGYPQLDPPPFPVLGFTLSVASLYIVILILAAQRQEDQLAQLREQLTLELALLSEQKTAKVIQLLEEFRRDLPLVHNRIDEQADAMAEPADPGRVLEAIKETHAEAEEIRGSP